MRRPNTRPTFIYWLIDTRTNTPFYCGKTVQEPHVRLIEHRSDAKRGLNRPNSRRINECGEHIRIHVVEVVPPNGDWVSREKRWIELLRFSFPGATNVADGGTGVPGFVPTPEHQRKISNGLKARWQSPEYRAKQADALRRKWESPEYREKMTLLLRSRKPSRECIEKASAARSKRAQNR